MKLFLLLIILYPFNASAFKFSPMSLTITPANNERSAMVYLENDSNAPIAIQMSVAKRLMDKSGKEENPEETDDVDLYPSQLIIPAFEKKSVKVSWIGKELGLSEKAFRIIAEQLPIELDSKINKKKGNVKILLRYVGALYISPIKTQSSVNLLKFSLKENKLNFVFENKGTKHQVLGNLKLTFSKEKQKTIEMKSIELKNFSGENILANSEREFILARDGKLQKVDDTFQVKFNFEQD